MLTLSTTNRCNLHCIYCSTSAGKRLDDELDLSEKRHVIRQAKKMGAKVVSLCGTGEPMLDDDFHAIVDEIATLGMMPLVITNGTLIDSPTAQWLFQRGAHMILKLNSLDRHVVDTLAGTRAAYSWVSHGRWVIPAGIKALRDVGFKGAIGAPGAMQIESVITPHNLRDLLEVARLSRALEGELFLDTLLWLGRARKNQARLEISKKDYDWLLWELVRILGPRFYLRQKKVTCKVEQNPVVGPTGEIQVCHLRGANLGNVRERSLQELFLETRQLRKTQAAPSWSPLFDGPFRTCSARLYHQQQASNQASSYRKQP
jgi:MoaA/NifB/PqqE/SkfB family radical SAM enzyme